MDRTWEVLASGYGLAEAPTIDTDGALLFSDVLGGGVYRLDRNRGDVATVVPKRRGVGGIALHTDGGIVCSGRDIVHVRDGETRTVLHVDGVAGWNDLATDAVGAVYAGALRFAVFDPAATAVPGEIWCAGPDRAPAPLVDGIVHANGMAFSPDEQMLYVSDTHARRVIVYDVARDARREIDIAPYGHPDGMAVDEHGAIWLALVGGGIGRFLPDGTLDQRIEPPSSVTTSVCFDGHDLFVTTGGHSEQPELGGCIMHTTVDVAGMPTAPARV